MNSSSPGFCLRELNAPVQPCPLLPKPLPKGSVDFRISVLSASEDVSEAACIGAFLSTDKKVPGLS